MASLKQDSTRTLQASGSQSQQPKQEKKEKKETPKLLEFETTQTSTKYVYVGKLPYNQRGGLAATTASFVGRNGRQQQQQQQSKPKKVEAPEGYVSDGFIYFNITNGPYGSFADAYQVFKHKKEVAAAPAAPAATSGAASPRAASPAQVQEQHGSTSPGVPKSCSPVPQAKPQQPPQQQQKKDKRESSKHHQQHRQHQHHQQPQQFGGFFGGQPAPYGFQAPQQDFQRHHHHHQQQSSRFVDPFGAQPQLFGAPQFGSQFGNSRLFADNGFQRLDGSRHHHHHQQQQPLQQQNGHNNLPADLLVGSNRKSEKREHRHKKREHKRKDKPVAANGIIAPIPINPVAAVNGEASAVKSAPQVVALSVVTNANSKTTSPSILAQLVDVKVLVPSAAATPAAVSPSVSPSVEVLAPSFEGVHISSN